MRNGRSFPTLLTFLIAAVVTFPAAGQSVISTHSGLVYYFDGAVYLGDQPLEPRLGTFPTVPLGAELHTAQGRAEVLLTPGVFLRIGEQTAIRMAANDLANTRVELRSGSAIVDSSQPASGTSVTLIFKDWQIRSGQAGAYRIDSDPPRVVVLKGDADVFAGPGAQPVKVEQGMDLPFAKVLVPEQAGPQSFDGLSAWDKGRSDSIVADNAITQHIDADPGSQTGDVDGFSYFPFLGVPAAGLSTGAYSSIMPAQPGFYSMYLPGYTYAPLLVGMIGPRTFTRFSTLPPRIGTAPGTLRIGGVGVGPGAPRPVVAPARPIAHPVIHR